jgi:hypothetical protein
VIFNKTSIEYSTCVSRSMCGHAYAEPQEGEDGTKNDSTDVEYLKSASTEQARRGEHVLV